MLPEAVKQESVNVWKHKSINKRYRKLKGQSIMDNPKKQATLGTQDKRRRQTKQNKNTTRSTTEMSNPHSSKTWYSRRVCSSYLLQETRHATHIVNMCWTSLCATNTNNINKTWALLQINCFKNYHGVCNKSLKIPKEESDPHIEEEQTTQWPNKSNMKGDTSGAGTDIRTLPKHLSSHLVLMGFVLLNL